ncbi:hypothetical protein R5R35_007310 [Gryllus longicercus]|uniref:Vacuolar protein sorting-associated protein 18 homolog n=1 Tax=Gryllus longicercus TaxID=2509291 RepID=A0AAN9VUS8_9ORTH
MTSLFDQQTQASQRYKGPTSTNVAPEAITTGFIHMKLEEDTPIFTKQKVNFAPSDRITHLCVSNELLVLAMANDVLLRIDLRRPEQPETIDLSRYTSSLRVNSLFVDPLGLHVLISLSGKSGDAELLYLARKAVKPKSASKLKGHEVTAVGWNFGNESESSTGPILLGTSRGLIFETELLLEGERVFPSGLEQYWRQVFDIGKGEHMPITGLEFHRVPGSDTYFVLVTTAQRLYQFCGSVGSVDEKPLLQQIFNNYLAMPEAYQDIPSNLKYSHLEFSYQGHRGPPKTFAWLTEPGIFYCKVIPSRALHGDTVLADSQLVRYPVPASGAPMSFVLSHFHALLLYPDHVVGVSLLNQEPVFEDIYSETYGKLVNIAKDPIKGTIWAFTEKAVFRYKVTQEERNVWKIYMEQGEFELAKQYCRDNPAHRDQVLVRQAGVFFKEKQYEQSALHYAETQCSFEEVALKFMQVREVEALKTFLKKKLEGLRPQDKTQVTMLVMWVLELCLNQLGELRDAGEVRSPRYQELQRHLSSFLEWPSVLECVRNNRSTVYELMASHGDKENLVKLTLVNKDYEKVVRQHLYENNYLDALEVLRTHGRKELFYQFAPTLMQAIPRQTVQVLIAQGRQLNPAKLLPALVTCEPQQASEAVRYLEFCVQQLGCRQQAVHNYLLSLYARLQPDQLMSYLVSQGQDASVVCYDIHYALRLCRELGLAEACVRLSALLGLWEAAVELALPVSVDLAKRTAQMPPSDDTELRRKLWLKIAKHVVGEQEDVGQAMRFLQESELLKIEDVLPFFPDFTTIDHFRDAICSSLQEYNQHIQDLKEEMEEATKSAEEIRDQIQNFRNRCAHVGVQDACEACGQALLLRAFYLFPCGHRLHSDCLLAELTPLLGAAERARLGDLQRQLVTMSGRDDTVSLGSASMSARDQVKAEIDDLVASECLYCGERMIRSIDKPFIDDEDYDRVMKDWE